MSAPVAPARRIVRPNQRRTARRPQLERDTPLVALAAARAVVEEASLHLGRPLPGRFAVRIAHQARRTFAHGAQFRRLVSAPGNRGRDQLYVFLRHWLAARLHEDRPALFRRLPPAFANGLPCLCPGHAELQPDPPNSGEPYLSNETRQLIA